jgi:hypothetical protein
MSCGKLIAEVSIVIVGARCLRARLAGAIDSWGEISSRSPIALEVQGQESVGGKASVAAVAQCRAS